MLVVFYVSGHGLGHASRAVELISALTTGCPDIRIVVRTDARRWAFERTRSPAVDVQPFETDPGVVQIDSLTLDEDETARRAAQFYGDFDRRVSDEADRLRDLGATFVLGDIPPLAFAAAHRAGVRSVAVANFTWDWIYGHYPQFERIAPGVLDTIARAYAHADLALRLPMHGGFEPMMEMTRDIPFIARRSTGDPAETRRALGLDAGRPIVLASFGGYGVELPADRIARSGRLSLVAPERDAPSGLKYEDLVAAADVVVSKPGYGIVSECIANDTALLYTSRGRFAEYDVMVGEMPRVLRCRYIAQEDVLAGRWADAVDALLAQPPPPDRAAINGAAVAAGEILKLAIG